MEDEDFSDEDDTNGEWWLKHQQWAVKTPETGGLTYKHEKKRKRKDHCPRCKVESWVG
jgi:hypothetical protein